MINSITKRLNFKLIFGLHMQEAIFKVNTVKEVAKALKQCLTYGNYDNVVKQKIKKSRKHIKNIAQSCYLRL